MPDDRTYIKVHDGMPEHPKVAKVGGDAGWLNVCAMAYCSRNTTDGKISATVVPRISDRRAPMKLAAQLVEADLWHDKNSTCDRCPPAAVGEYVVHDYLEHQRSKAQIEAMKEQRRSAGRSGGLAKAKRDAKQVAKQNASKTLAVSEEVPNGTSQTDELEHSSSSKTPRRKPKTPPPDILPITPEMESWATEHAPDVKLRVETARMLDWARGKGESKSDWIATWRNWMSRAQDQASERKTQHDGRFDASGAYTAWDA